MISGIKSVFFTPIRGWRLPDGTSTTLNTDSASILKRNQLDIYYALKNDSRFYEMDGVITENYAHSISLTKNPVENGTVISDHSYREPYVISVTGIITNNPSIMQSTNHIPGTYKFDQTSGAGFTNAAARFGVNAFTGNRIREAWLGLTAMMNNKEMVTVYTALAVYKNMVITNLSTVNDQKNQLMVNMTFTEVIHIDEDGISEQNRLANAVFGIELDRVMATASSVVNAAIGSI